MTLRAPEETFIRSDADLFELWCDLMGAGGFAQRSLWMIFVEESAQLSRVVVPIDDLPDEPDALFCRNVGLVLAQPMQPPVRSAALLLSRPGPVEMLDGDRRWARALRAAIDPASMPWPLHLATAERIRVFAPDDLISVPRS